MIALPNLTVTLQALNEEQRERIVDLIAQRYLDSMSVKDLERFFYDIQTEYLKEYSDQELIGELEDYSTAEEFQELLYEA